MVRMARFAFDDHRDVHRRPLDELNDDADDAGNCCFEIPPAASAREQNEPAVAPDALASADAADAGSGPSLPPAGRNRPPRKAA